jgi:mevalonate kinase
VKTTFYSNGKLLLTGEYLVLDGAKALALPTKYGQNLTVRPGTNREIIWKSFDSDGSVWFEDRISFDEIIAEKDPHAPATIKSTLVEILHEAYKLNPELIKSGGYMIETHLTFPKFWGLGTSSTLINNIAQWQNVDAFALLRNSFGGSGYDIACAQNDTPIIYRLENNIPIVDKASFHPTFVANLYFVYLNRKQSSKAAIASYYANREVDFSRRIASIDSITQTLIDTNDIKVFTRLIERHESIMSEILEMETVRETFFRDFEGTVKSLGGWGGDFILAVSASDPRPYFAERGFNTVIPYRDMILPQ